MRSLKILFMCAVVAMLSACSSSHVRSSYNPVAINNVAIEDAATIKVASGLGILKVDKKRQASLFKVMLFDGHDSIYLEEGRHSITGSMKGQDIHLGNVVYEKGHEYFIDYLKTSAGYNSYRVSIWIKDLTTGKVIYGKEQKEDI